LKYLQIIPSESWYVRLGDKREGEIFHERLVCFALVEDDGEYSVVGMGQDGFGKKALDEGLVFLRYVHKDDLSEYLFEDADFLENAEREWSGALPPEDMGKSVVTREELERMVEEATR